jgi:hypothetical protein
MWGARLAREGVPFGGPSPGAFLALSGVRLGGTNDVAVVTGLPLVQQRPHVLRVVRLVGNDLADPRCNRRIHVLKAAPVSLKRDQRALLDRLKQHEHRNDAIHSDTFASFRKDFLDVVEGVDNQLPADRDVVRVGRGLEGLDAELLHDLPEVGAVLLFVGRVAGELGRKLRIVDDVLEHAKFLGPLKLGTAKRVQHLDALLKGELA